MRIAINSLAFVMEYQGKRKVVTAEILMPDADGINLVSWQIDGKVKAMFKYVPEDVSIGYAKLVFGAAVGFKSFKPHELKCSSVIAKVDFENATETRSLSLTRYPRGSVYFNSKLLPHGQGMPFVNEVSFFEAVALRNRRYLLS